MEFTVKDVARALDMSEADALCILAEWEAYPVVFGGELHGFALLNGTEHHYVGMPERKGRTFTRRNAREHFTKMLTLRDYLTTKAPLDDPELERVCLVSGFAKTWSDGFFQYYIMTRPPFGPRS